MDLKIEINRLSWWMPVFLSKKGFLDCRSLRGRSETVLYECRDDLTAHLKNCFLLDADLKEYEVILQRVGFER